MNNQFYQIEPKVKIIEKTLTTFSIKITEFIFNQSVSLLVSFYDTDGAIIENNFLLLEGSDYNNWSNDDNYIINYICDKYGLTLKNNIQ
jgi:hypothetical protein